MKKVFTLFVSFLICTLAFGQGKEAVFAKTGEVKPVIDGVLDDVWTAVEQHDIVTPFKAEAATVGEEGTTYWKALWDDAGIYVIVVVNDNTWSPYTGTTGTSDYNYDKVEMYFDTNFLLEDGKGGQVGTTGNRQIAPNPTLDKLNGEMLVGKIGDLTYTYNYAFKVEDPAWNLEMFVPWDAILDENEQPFDKSATMGFDVQVTDNDDGLNARNRVYWSNAGGKDESWNNMDDAGHVTLDGAGDGVDIESITVSGELTITSDNGTTQLSAAILPENATQAYKWELTNETGMATISKTGLVSALRDGTVKVKAVSIDEFTPSNEVTITISNQKVTLDEISLIKNGDFDKGADKMESWGFTKKEVFTVEADGDDEWLAINCTPQTNRWDINVNQRVDVSLDKTIKYIVRFKAYASTDLSVPLIIEDTYNGTYNKDGVSTSPYGTSSDWAIPVTTEPKWFELDVTFANRIDESTYSFGFQPGALTGTLYLDSIYMFKESDLELVWTSSESIADNQLNVYPNPVNNTLYVDLSDINAKVAIYNSVGQKLMEKTATSNRVQFDVSALRKGMYIVRLSDGTSRKFVK